MDETKVEEVENPTTEEVRAATITPEQEKLLEKLLKLKGAKEAAMPAKCPSCGSPEHAHCNLPSHMQARKIDHPEHRG